MQLPGIAESLPLPAFLKISHNHCKRFSKIMRLTSVREFRIPGSSHISSPPPRAKRAKKAVAECATPLVTPGKTRTNKTVIPFVVVRILMLNYPRKPPLWSDQ